MTKYEIVLEVEISDERDVETAVDSALTEYGIHVEKITAYKKEDSRL